MTDRLKKSWNEHRGRWILAIICFVVVVGTILAVLGGLGKFDAKPPDHPQDPPGGSTTGGTGNTTTTTPPNTITEQELKNIGVSYEALRNRSVYEAGTTVFRIESADAMGTVGTSEIELVLVGAGGGGGAGGAGGSGAGGGICNVYSPNTTGCAGGAAAGGGGGAGAGGSGGDVVRKNITVTTGDIIKVVVGERGRGGTTTPAAVGGAKYTGAPQIDGRIFGGSSGRDGLSGETGSTGGDTILFVNDVEVGRAVGGRGGSAGAGGKGGLAGANGGDYTGPEDLQGHVILMNNRQFDGGKGGDGGEGGQANNTDKFPGQSGSGGNGGAGGNGGFNVNGTFGSVVNKWAPVGGMGGKSGGGVGVDGPGGALGTTILSSAARPYSTNTVNAPRAVAGGSSSSVPGAGFVGHIMLNHRMPVGSGGDGGSGGIGGGGGKTAPLYFQTQDNEVGGNSTSGTKGSDGVDGAVEFIKQIRPDGSIAPLRLKRLK